MPPNNPKVPFTAIDDMLIEPVQNQRWDWHWVLRLECATKRASLHSQQQLMYRAHNKPESKLVQSNTAPKQATELQRKLDSEILHMIFPFIKDRSVWVVNLQQ